MTVTAAVTEVSVVSVASFSGHYKTSLLMFRSLAMNTVDMTFCKRHICELASKQQSCTADRAANRVQLAAVSRRIRVRGTVLKFASKTAPYTADVRADLVVARVCVGAAFQTVIAACMAR